MLLVMTASAAPAQQTQSEWAKHIYDAILRSVRYPPEAAKTSQQGGALVEFRVRPSGEILSRQILESSGHADLDAAALDAIDRAAPFPPFPPDMKDLSVVVLKLPIRFRPKKSVPADIMVPERRR
jgi:protein TonB